MSRRFFTCLTDVTFYILSAISTFRSCKDNCWGQGWDSCSSSAIVPAQLGWLTFCPGPIVLGQMVSRHVDKVGTVALAQGSCPHNWAGPPNAPAQMGEICVWTRLVLAQMLSPQKPLALRRRTSSSGTNMFFLFIWG
jgi:hypothetical protein